MMRKINDGGAAFPCYPGHYENIGDQTEWISGDDGMTYRQWLAGQALASIAAPGCGYEPSRVAQRAVELADALIEELNKEPAP